MVVEEEIEELIPQSRPFVEDRTWCEIEVNKICLLTCKRYVIIHLKPVR